MELKPTGLIGVKGVEAALEIAKVRLEAAMKVENDKKEADALVEIGRLSEELVRARELEEIRAKRDPKTLPGTCDKCGVEKTLIGEVKVDYNEDGTTKKVDTSDSHWACGCGVA